MWPNPLKTTEEILNGKLNFLDSGILSFSCFFYSVLLWSYVVLLFSLMSLSISVILSALVFLSFNRLMLGGNKKVAYP